MKLDKLHDEIEETKFWKWHFEVNWVQSKVLNLILMEQVYEERKIKKKINEAIKYNNESKKYILALFELLRLDEDILPIDIMEWEFKEIYWWVYNFMSKNSLLINYEYDKYEAWFYIVELFNFIMKWQYLWFESYKKHINPKLVRSWIIQNFDLSFFNWIRDDLSFFIEELNYDVEDKVKYEHEKKKNILDTEIIDNNSINVNTNFALDKVLRDLNQLLDIFRNIENREKIFIDLFIELWVVKVESKEITYVDDFQDLPIYETVYDFVLEYREAFLYNSKLKPILSLCNYLLDADSMNKYCFNDFEKEYWETINLLELQLEFEKLISKLKKKKKTA